MNVTDTINYAIDIQYDYNIKLVVFGLITLYIVLGLLYVRRMQIEYLYQYYLHRLVHAVAVPYFIFLPLYVFFLQRTLDINVVLRLMLFFYSGILVVSLVLFFVYGSEKIKSFFSSEGFYRRYKR